MNQKIESIRRMGKIIKAIRSDPNGDGEEKTPCAEFHITVFETGDYDKVSVTVESSDSLLVDWVCACAYFMSMVANRTKLDFDEALSMLCEEAKEFETKVISMRR